MGWLLRYFSTPPTLATQQGQAEAQCDTRGNLKVTPVGLNGVAAYAPVLGAGTASIGTVVAQKQTTATPARVASSATNVTLLASNAARIKAIIYNESTQIVYVKYGATATATDYTVQIVPGGTLVVDTYSGRIDGIWVSAQGAAQVTEL